MNLSISSSDRKTWAKIMLVILMALLAVELFLREFGPKLSRDTDHLTEIPARARLFDATSFNLLILGNSTTREGIDQTTLKRSMKHPQRPITLTSFYPDDSYIREWFFLYRKQFLVDNTPPDVLVIPFCGQWLRDKAVYQPERLGHFFVGKEDWATALSGCNEADDKIRLMAGFECATVVYKERVRKRILNTFVPDYQQLAQATNDVRVETEPKQSAQLETYTLMERLQKTTRDHNTVLVFVALPTPFQYELSPQLRDRISRGGSQLIDLRNSVPITPGNFKDDIHLAPNGARLFTKKLALELQKIMDGQKYK